MFCACARPNHALLLGPISQARQTREVTAEICAGDRWWRIAASRSSGSSPSANERVGDIVPETKCMSSTIFPSSRCLDSCWLGRQAPSCDICPPALDPYQRAPRKIKKIDFQNKYRFFLSFSWTGKICIDENRAYGGSLKNLKDLRPFLTLESRKEE